MTLKSLLIRIGADVSDFKAKMNQIEKGVDKNKAKIQKGLNKVSVALIGVGIAAGKASIDFNKSMANVATLIPGNIKRVEELKKGVQSLSVETGKSTADIAGGLYQVISAFGDTSDTVKILDTNVRAAAAGLATTTDAINLTSAVTKGYGDTTAAAVEKAADLAFVTVKLGQTTFPELASSIGKVIPFAQAMNVSQEELFAGFAALTGVTGNAAEVSTQFKGILGAMVTPTEAMTAALEKSGYATHGLMIEDLGLQGALELLKSKTDGTIVGMGKLFSEKEGLIGVTALLGAQEKAYTEKLKEMVKGAGAGAEAYREMTEGINKTGFAFDRAKASVVVMLQTLGDELAPVISSIADGVRKFTQKISILIKGFKTLPSPIKSMVLALGGLLALSAPLFKMFMMMRTGLLRVDKLMGTKLASSLGSLTGVLRKLPAVGFAAFAGWKIGRAIGELTGLDEGIQNVAGSLLDIIGYAQGMNAEFDNVAGKIERTAKAQEILAAASNLAGIEITTLKEAAAILGAQYEETGTAGNAMLDEWVIKAGLAQEETNKLREEVEDIPKSTDKAGADFSTFTETIIDLMKQMTAEMKKETKSDYEYSKWILEEKKKDRIAAIEKELANGEAKNKALALLEENHKTLMKKLDEEHKAGMLEREEEQLEAAEERMNEEFEKAEEFRKKELEKAKEHAEKVKELGMKLTDDLNQLTMDEYNYKSWKLDKWATEKTAAAKEAHKETEEFLAAKEKIEKIHQMKQDELDEYYANKKKQRLKDSLMNMASAISSFLSEVRGLYDAQYQRRLEQIDDEYQKRLDAINNSQMNEEQKAAAILALDAEVARKKEAIEKKVAKVRKKIAIATAIINIAQGITAALSTTPPLSFVLAALVAAAGAIQLAAIISQPLAEGGIVKKRTFAEIGEKGTEVVLPLDRLKSMGGLVPAKEYQKEKKLTANKISSAINDIINSLKSVSTYGAGGRFTERQLAVAGGASEMTTSDKNLPGAAASFASGSAVINQYNYFYGDINNTGDLNEISARLAERTRRAIERGRA